MSRPRYIDEVYPQGYQQWVANELGCNTSDLCLLGVNPAYEYIDEEGWHIESFFPSTAEIHTRLVHSDVGREDVGEFEKPRLKALCFDDFVIGGVIRIQVNDTAVFIADYNASPCNVWANKNKLAL